MSELNENGLVIDRYPEKLKSIQSDQQAKISSEFAYNDNTIIYQLNAIIAKIAAENAEILEAVYNAKRLTTATGNDLDYLGLLKRVTRLPESSSFTDNQLFTGDPGVVINAGSLFANPVTNDEFTNQSTITLSSNTCQSASLAVITLLPNTIYSVSVNGVFYTYTSDASPTNQEILVGLRDEIEDDTGASYTAEMDGTDTLVITTDDEENISVIVTSYIEVAKTTVKGTLEAVNVGAIIAAPNTVTEIKTTIAGLDSTTNPDQYILGRLKETDDEYRVRVAEGQGVSCTGTIPSITAYLLNEVEGIGSVEIIENTTGVDDVDGRPGHSYEVIVTGGTDQDIAQAIWFTKGAGIELFGNTSVNIVDTSGSLRVVKFTRPIAVNVAYRITYSLYDEEIFPTQGEEGIKNVVLEKNNILDIDEDIIPSRFFGPIYSAVSGIDSLTVEVQELTNAGDTPIEANWQTDRLEIAGSEFASTILGDIYIVSA